MSFLTRFTPALLLLASAISTVSATTLEARGRGGNDCGRNEWWFGGKGCCLPNGGPSFPPSPPQGSKCPPSGWYWHSNKGCCVPHTPYSPQPSCDKDWEWNSGSLCCKPKPSPPSNNCKSNEWWWGDKGCCLPKGGPPSVPNPPSGTKCPKRGWYWHGGQGCCVPQNPEPPAPECDNDWSWHGPSRCCKPHGPQPSARSIRARHRSRTVKLCPFGLDACPLSGLTSEFECLDTKTELESCGGCTSVGQGQDCTAIPGAWNVGCDNGSCKVFNCSPGFTLSADQKSCVSLE